MVTQSKKKPARAKTPAKKKPATAAAKKPTKPKPAKAKAAAPKAAKPKAVKKSAVAKPKATKLATVAPAAAKPTPPDRAPAVLGVEPLRLSPDEYARLEALLGPSRGAEAPDPAKQAKEKDVPPTEHRLRVLIVSAAR